MRADAVHMALQLGEWVVLFLPAAALMAAAMLETAAMTAAGVVGRAACCRDLG